MDSSPPYVKETTRRKCSICGKRRECISYINPPDFENIQWVCVRCHDV